MDYSAIPQNSGNLRDYQIEAKREIFSSWDRFDSVMLQMPTGTGNAIYDYIEQVECDNLPNIEDYSLQKEISALKLAVEAINTDQKNKNRQSL